MPFILFHGPSCTLSSILLMQLYSVPYEQNDDSLNRCGNYNGLQSRVVIRNDQSTSRIPVYSGRYFIIVSRRARAAVGGLVVYRRLCLQCLSFTAISQQLPTMLCSLRSFL